MESRVKWFNNEKGFGFLENQGKEDIFVHYSQIVMDGYKTLKGLQAKNVETTRKCMVN